MSTTRRIYPKDDEISSTTIPKAIGIATGNYNQVIINNHLK